MKKILAVTLALMTVLYLCSFPVFSLVSGKYSYIIENGKAVITEYTGKDANITVPNTLDGYPVFAIGEGAFGGNKSLTSVTVADGICEIRDNAFNSCSNLSVIKLPSSLIRFGENAVLGTAYYNNKSNWTIKPENLGSSEEDWILGNGQDTIPWEFIKADKLEYLYLGTVLVKCIVEGSYVVRYDTTVIADGAFSGQSKLKDCTLSPKAVTLGARAFKDCASLTKISISDNCKIYDDAFFNSGIYNSHDNWKGDFLTIGTRAVASKKDCTELVAVDGITSISNGTIGNRNVYIPQSVTKIDIDAFSGKDSVIYGFGGTYAEDFAKENGFRFVDLNDIMLGDMDFDGLLTSNDYAIYRASVTCSHKMTKYEKMAGDLNLDGAVDAFDMLYLQNLINDKTATINGDINGNGKIGDEDYIFLSNFVKCRCEGVGENFYKRSDLNGDGTVDGFDAIYLNAYLHGKASLK